MSGTLVGLLLLVALGVGASTTTTVPKKAKKKPAAVTTTTLPSRPQSGADLQRRLDALAHGATPATGP